MTARDGINASYVEIGRRGRVTGPIHANEVLVGERARVENVYAGRITVEEKAQARNLYGESIYIESGCYVDGEVHYTDSLRTEENVVFKEPPVKVEKLPQ